MISGCLTKIKNDIWLAYLREPKEGQILATRIIIYTEA
jgi:hypothetical protein